MSLFKLYEKYCSDKVLNDLTSLKDLNTLIEKYVHDPLWSQELQNLDDLVPCFALLNSDENKHSLQNFIALRVLYYIVGPVWTTTLLSKFDSQHLMGSWTQKLDLALPDTLILDSFDHSKVLKNIIGLTSLQLNGTCKFNHEGSKSVLDLSVNAQSLDILQNSKLNKYIVLVDAPNKEHPNSIYKDLERNFKQVKLQKGVLFVKSDCKIFYDDQGNMMVNRKLPYHTIHHAFPSFTLSDAINKFKCDLIKLELNDLSYQQLLLSETHKAIKKHVNQVMIVINEPFTDHFNISNFSVDELIKPYTKLIKLITSMNERNPKFKPLLQLDSNRPNELVLTFNA